MMAINTLYASGGKAVIIPTIELFSIPWAAPIYMCAGFTDIVATTEYGVTAKFEALAFDSALPKMDNSGNQSITFAIDNVGGQSQQLIDGALESRMSINMAFRIFLSNDLSAPAQRPYYMKVLGGFMEGGSVQLQGGYFDLVNLGFPRRMYTLDFAPCLRYI